MEELLQSNKMAASSRVDSGDDSDNGGACASVHEEGSDDSQSLSAPSPLPSPPSWLVSDGVGDITGIDLSHF